MSGEEHICCFHTWQSTTFMDKKAEWARCCWCSRERRTGYELRPMEGHGPRAPKVLVKVEERIVE